MIRIRTTDLYINGNVLFVYQGLQGPPVLGVRNLSFDNYPGLFFEGKNSRLNMKALKEAVRDSHYIHPSGEVFTMKEWEEEKKYIDTQL